MHVVKETCGTVEKMANNIIDYFRGILLPDEIRWVDDTVKIYRSAVISASGMVSALSVHGSVIEIAFLSSGIVFRLYTLTKGIEYLISELRVRYGTGACLQLIDYPDFMFRTLRLLFRDDSTEYSVEVVAYSYG